MTLTADRLREVVRYDPATGVFTRLVSTAPNARAGDFAGSLRKRGILAFHVDGKLYAAHRLAWLYMTGKWPDDDIDHRDGNKVNNRWDNLRDVDDFTNLQNLRKAMKSNKTTGLLGASWSKQIKRFKAQITVDGANTYIGTFSTAMQAHEAYVEAKRRLHPGNTL